MEFVFILRRTLKTLCQKFQCLFVIVLRGANLMTFPFALSKRLSIINEY